jgi:DNA-binding MurR/RpiR family transcriptional regulator
MDRTETQERGQGGFRDCLQKLSPRRQELIRSVLEHPREHVLLSARGVARKLGTDPATIVRIVQRMGFSSYRDFQTHLYQRSMVLATRLELMQTTRARNSDLPGHVSEVLDRDLRNLHGLRNSLDVKAVIALAKRLHSARRILILGGDLATSLVVFLEYNLAILGLPALTATTPGRTVHTLRTIGKGDVVIAIGFRGGLRQTVEGVREARTRGAYCVGITDSFLSPVARFAHTSLLASIEGPVGDSYVAPIALLNVLLIACANHRRTRTLALLKEAEREQRSGYRWYREN